MRHLMFLLSVLLAVYFASSTPINPKRLLINRPEEYVPRSSRSAPPYTKTEPSTDNRSNLELNLRKGEYICDGKVCALRPGEIPKDCFFCQYRLE